jgi:hypothetical protein
VTIGCSCIARDRKGEGFGILQYRYILQLAYADGAYLSCSSEQHNHTHSKPSPSLLQVRIKVNPLGIVGLPQRGAPGRPTMAPYDANKSFLSSAALISSNRLCR